MKTILISILVAFVVITNGQELKIPFDLLKSELEKKEAKESLMNSIYWQNSTASLIRFSSLGHGTIQTFDTRYEGVKGSPYLYEEWKKGAVLLAGTTEPLPALLNYDCVNGQLLVRMPDGQPASLPVEAVNAFLISTDDRDDEWAFFVSDVSEKGGKTFYQVIYNEKTVLYKHLKKHFKPADYQRAYSPNRRYDEFEWDNQLYLKRENEIPEKIKLNAKAIISHFPDKSKELQDFISAGKLKFKSDEDLIRIIAYYDSL